jgi:hypothetical protein
MQLSNIRLGFDDIIKNVFVIIIISKISEERINAGLGIVDRIE